MSGTGAHHHILQHILEDIKTFDSKSMLIFSWTTQIFHLCNRYALDVSFCTKCNPNYRVSNVLFLFSVETFVYFINECKLCLTIVMDLNISRTSDGSICPSNFHLQLPWTHSFFILGMVATGDAILRVGILRVLTPRLVESLTWLKWFFSFFSNTQESCTSLNLRRRIVQLQNTTSHLGLEWGWWTKV